MLSPTGVASTTTIFSRSQSRRPRSARSITMVPVMSSSITFGATCFIVPVSSSRRRRRISSTNVRWGLSVHHVVSVSNAQILNPDVVLLALQVNEIEVVAHVGQEVHPPNAILRIVSDLPGKGVGTGVNRDQRRILNMGILDLVYLRFNMRHLALEECKMLIHALAPLLSGDNRQNAGQTDHN